MTDTFHPSGTEAEMLSDLVNRIRRVIEPRRILLFGSAARGELGPHSDLDILVIVPDGVHRRHTAQKIYGQMGGLGRPVDIVVVTEGDVRKYADYHAAVLCPALREGKELYAA